MTRSTPIGGGTLSSCATASRDSTRVTTAEGTLCDRKRRKGMMRMRMKKRREEKMGRKEERKER